MVKVVTPGIIQPEHGKCGVCWGSLTTDDPEEVCSGQGARMLPSGHIFGRKCLLSTFKIGNEGQPRGTNTCPACRQLFRVSFTRHSSTLPFYKESIAKYSNMVLSLGRIGLVILPLLRPYIYAVAISMNIGVKVNVFSDHWLRTTPRWLRIALAILMVAASAVLDPFTGLGLLYTCYHGTCFTTFLLMVPLNDFITRVLYAAL